MKKTIPDYPGKPGPKPSGGAKRKILFPLALNDDEYEYLNRWSRHLGVKAAVYIRELIFHKNWKSVLRRIRAEQGGNLKS